MIFGSFLREAAFFNAKKHEALKNNFAEISGKEVEATGEDEMSHIPVNEELQLLWAECRGATFGGVERQSLHRGRGGSLAQLIVVSTISTGYYLSKNLKKLASPQKLVERRKEKMRASRHNGRSGKHGVYDVKHNDRDFDVANSEHIDAERTKQNVYWDCYQGYCLNGATSERKMTFTEIEQAYYFEHYGDHVDAQNERNVKGGHAERNRTTDDVLNNNKTCPEESILQLGNIDCTVPPDVLAKVVAEFFEEFEKRYGSHVHILDWALHMDEATPHVHVRQVYDALNKYGELCPQQEKALEELGFELPDPTKKKGRFNNRKMCFDAECRKLFLDIGQKNGVELEYDPKYGGASYLEKQDYIIEKLRQQISEQQVTLQNLTMQISDIEKFAEEIAEEANEKACEVVSDTVVEQTREEDIRELRSYKKWLISDERKTPKDKRDFVGKCLDALEVRLRKMAQTVADKVLGALQNPQIKEQKKEEIKQRARVSVREKLAEHQKQVELEKQRKAETPKVKKQKTEELG